VISAKRRLAEAEARLKAVINSTVDAIVTATADGTIVLVSRGAAEMFGVTAEAALGTDVIRFIPARFHESYRGGIRKLGNAGRLDHLTVPGELSGLRADGTEFPVEVTLSGFALGGVQYVTAVVRDVTSRRAALAELEKALEQLGRRTSELQALFDVLPVGVGIAHDAEGRDIAINPEFARQLGIPVEVNASKFGPGPTACPSAS
jgi:PAS domain S-box-containing protein